MMKTTWLLARLALCGALFGIGAFCSAGPIITTARVGDLELSLILESDNAYIGRPYPVEVVVKNIGTSEAVLFTVRNEFLKNFEVKVFDLFAASPVPLTLQGKRAQDMSLERTKEVKLAPGEETSFFHPMLGWFFDLSVPSNYRIELTWTWAMAVKPELPQGSQPTLTAEFGLNPDTNMRTKPLGLLGAKTLSEPGAKADKPK